MYIEKFHLHYNHLMYRKNEQFQLKNVESAHFYIDIYIIHNDSKLKCKD